MGSICGCTTIKNSEQYLRLLIETTCLQNINDKSLENSLIYHIKRSTDDYNQLRLEINEELYQMITKDIIDSKFTSKETKHSFTSPHIPVSIVKKFLEKIYDIINFNNKANVILFKLVFSPITMKDSGKEDDDTDEAKAKQLFYLLKSIHLKDWDDIDLSLDAIPFNQFCDSLLFYITSVISGYSKKLYEALTELQTEPLIRYDLLDNLQDYFEIKLFNSYFKRILGKFIKQLLLTKREENIDEYNVTYDDFELIINDNPQLIHYFKLREDFLLFAKKSKEYNYTS